MRELDQIPPRGVARKGSKELPDDRTESEKGGRGGDRDSTSKEEFPFWSFCD
jgi:hypothetical protein